MSMNVNVDVNDDDFVDDDNAVRLDDDQQGDPMFFRGFTILGDYKDRFDESHLTRTLLGPTRETRLCPINYRGVCVHHPRQGGRQIFEGSVVNGQVLTEQEAISLWQLSYLSFNSVENPKRLAALWRTTADGVAQEEEDG